VRRAAVEPRTSLADFLREELLLTGTHLGCEHGVCGACTVNIDGAPARSCIIYAVACDGAEVNTVEGFDDDELMAELRQAFSAEHALQCGYCTPGMLITARDIVQRLPGADESRIRVELSGNLCRCTGYVGIVKAIHRVIDQRTEAGSGVARRGPASVPERVRSPAPHRPAPAATTPSDRPSTPPAKQPEPGGKMTRLEQSFTIRHPRAAVWAMFRDLPRVVSCMPGASLTEPPQGGQIKGLITVKLGPIHANFSGEADVELDDAAYAGVIRGTGLDTGHSSRARGEVHYVLVEEDSRAATRVDVTVAFSLSGTLAQFSRVGIVNAVANRLTQAFAANLERALGDGRETGSRPKEPAQLDIGSLVFSVLWHRIKAVFDALFRKS
jgi:carbon-monoxide dehydrogenase small subunit